MNDENEIRKKLSGIDLGKRFDEIVKYRVSTGIKAFDIVTYGGIPSGRLTEFSGGEATAKSRLVAHIIAETQKAGGVAVLADTEKALDRGLIDLTGVDLGALIYPDPEKITSVEDIYTSLEKTIDVIRPQYPDKPITFVWDSVAATPGMEDLEKEIGRNEAGMRRAKLIGEGLRKYLASVYSAHIILIFVNQLRDKMNVMFGDRSDTPGGRSIKHLASLRIGMKIVGKIKDEQTKEQIGTHVELLVKKNRVGFPFGMVNFEMPVFEPISEYAGLLDYMKRHGELKHLGQGRYQFIEEEETFTKDQFPEAYKKWKKKISKKS